jgi:hypothetical protein
VRADSIARLEDLSWPPRIPSRVGFHEFTASGDSQFVTLPPWIRARSYQDQLAPRYFVLNLGWTQEFIRAACPAWQAWTQDRRRRPPELVAGFDSYTNAKTRTHFRGME